MTLTSVAELDDFCLRAKRCPGSCSFQAALFAAPGGLVKCTAKLGCQEVMARSLASKGQRVAPAGTLAVRQAARKAAILASNSAWKMLQNH